MAEFANFRQRLDAVLRTRDVEQVRAFLITEDQWSDDVPADPEFAMWMMVAGTPTLKDLHTAARSWLVEHGHAEEADALLKRAQSHNKPGAGQSKRPLAEQQKRRQKPRPDQSGAKTSSPIDRK
ncbi:MAG: hypothetical protein ABI234_12920 [Ktedonobacteraceae bacterium]